jgi:hypothetical protein
MKQEEVGKGSHNRAPERPSVPSWTETDRKRIPPVLPRREETQ